MNQPALPTEDVLFGDPVVELDQEAMERRIAEAATVDTRRTLYALLSQMRRIEQQVEQAEAWKRAIVAEVEEANAPRKRDLAFLHDQAADLALTLAGGSKHVDVPGLGRVQFRTQGEECRVVNEQAFVTYALEHELTDAVRVKYAPHAAVAKPVALDHLRETGELMPGTEYVPERTSASIQWGGAL